MSIVIDEVQAKFSADASSMQAALNQINASVNNLKAQTQQAGAQMEKSISSVNSHVSRMGGFFQQSLAAATGFFSAQVGWRVMDTGINAAKNALFGFNNTMQAAEIGFQTLTGSAEITGALLRQLQDIAQKTPFEFPDLTIAATRMMAFGFSAKEVGPLIRTIGDAASSTGQISIEQFNAITRAIGQMRTTGKLNAQDMMQLTNAGIAAWELMANKLGISTTKLREMSEQGILPADKAINALVSAMNDKFGGASERASKTFVGAMSSIKDSINIALGTAFRPLFDLMTEGLNKLAKWTQTSEDFKMATMLAAQGVQAFTNALREMFKGNNDPMKEIIGFVVKGIAYLTTNAAVWGFNFTAEFASGMLDAAGSALSAAIDGIVETIAGFFESHSPPKKGKLSRIDQWGTDLIITYMQGMTKADFSMLEEITDAIRDALKLDVMIGQLPENGLIPNLFGSQAAVAQAINELRTVGEVSEEVFSTLDALLGDSASGVNELVREFIELAKQDNVVRRLNDEIKKHQDEVDRLTAEYEDLKEEIEDQIKTAEHAHSVIMRGLNERARKVEELIRLAQAEKQQALNEQDIEIAQLQLQQNRNELTEAETAHIKRAVEAQKEVESATRSVRNAQEALNDEMSKGSKADPRRVRDLQQNVTDAQQRLIEAQRKANEAGKQTDEDRLRIAQARRAITQSEIDVATIGHQQALAGINAEKEAEERRLEETVRPLNEKLEDAAEAHRRATFEIQQQMEPLQAQLALETEKLEKQKESVETLQAAFDLQKGIADELDRQQKLQAQGAGGGSAGSKLPSGPLQFNFGNQEWLDKFKTETTTEITKKIEEMKADIKKKFGTAMTEALTSPELSGAAIGAALGAIFLGGPVGAAVGGVAGGLAGHFGKEWAAKLKVAFTGSEIVTGTESWLDEYGNVVQTNVSTRVVGKYEKEFGKVKEISGQVWNDVKTVSNAIIEPMVDHWNNQFQRVKDWGEENWPLIQQTAETAWDRIKFAGELFWKAFGGQFEATVAAVKTLWDGFWLAVSLVAEISLNNMLGALRTAMQIFNGDWSGAWETVKKTVLDNLKIIADKFKLEEFKAWGENMIEGVLAGLTERLKIKLPSFVNLWKSMRDAAMEGLGDLWPRSPSVAGKKVGDGFIDGVIARLLARRQEYADAFKNLAKAGAEAAKIDDKIGSDGTQSPASPYLSLPAATIAANANAANTALTLIAFANNAVQRLRDAERMQEEVAAMNRWTQAAFMGNVFNPNGVTGMGALTANGGNILLPSAANPFPYTNPLDLGESVPVSPLDNTSFPTTAFAQSLGLGEFAAGSGNGLLRFFFDQSNAGQAGLTRPQTYEEFLAFQRSERERLGVGEFSVHDPREESTEITVVNLLDGDEISSKYSHKVARRAEKLRARSSDY